MASTCNDYSLTNGQIRLYKQTKQACLLLAKHVNASVQVLSVYLTCARVQRYTEQEVPTVRMHKHPSSS